MEETYILYFKSYSQDEYFMKTKDSKCKELTSKQFAKQYIPYEYEAWGNEKFQYDKFKVYTVKDNKVITPRSFGEYYEVHPEDMKEYDVAYFTDQYRPDTYDREGNLL